MLFLSLNKSNSVILETKTLFEDKIPFWLKILNKDVKSKKANIKNKNKKMDNNFL